MPQTGLVPDVRGRARRKLRAEFRLLRKRSELFVLTQSHEMLQVPLGP